MKGKILKMFPETADGFRATVFALPYLGKSESVSFHIFPRVYQSVGFLLKNFEKRVAAADIQE
jgi:hypothetical protein